MNSDSSIRNALFFNILKYAWSLTLDRNVNTILSNLGEIDNEGVLNASEFEPQAPEGYVLKVVENFIEQEGAEDIADEDKVKYNVYKFVPAEFEQAFDEQLAEELAEKETN